MVNKYKRKNDIKKSSKKADMHFTIVRVILIIATFLILFAGIVNINDKASAEADKIACLTFIRASDSLGISSIVDFFSKTKDKCKVSTFTIDANQADDEIYQELADISRASWDKYGAGKYNFLNKFKSFEEGSSYCLLSSVVDFDNSNSNVLDYYKYIEWMETNTFNNGTHDVKYYDYISLRYFDNSNAQEYSDLKKEFQEAMEELKVVQDQMSKNTAMDYVGEFMKYENLRMKNINTNDKLYVVYKYEYIDPNLSDKLKSTMYGSMIGMGVGIFASSVAEFIIVSAVTGGVGAIPSAFYQIIKAPFTIVKAFSSTAKVAKASLKLSKLSKFLKMSGKTGVIMEKMMNFKKVAGKTDEIFEIAKDIRILSSSSTDDYAKLANVLDESVEILKSNQVTDLAGLSDEILKNEQQLQKLQDIAISAIDEKIISDKIFTNAAKVETTMVGRLDELRLVELELQTLKAKPIAQLTEAEKLKFVDYVRTLTLVGGTITGATLGFNYKPESIQYLDIMSPEEYYRVCGG